MRATDERRPMTDRPALWLAGIAVLICVVSLYRKGPRKPERIDTVMRAACRDNLSRIYEGLIEYQERQGHLPAESGARFLGALVADGVWENTAENAHRLTCPGVRAKALTVGELDPTEWFGLLDDVDGGCTSYAARNMRDFPLPELPGAADEPLVACDNDPDRNHDGVTNVLMADGIIVRLVDEELAVGPGSQLDWLRKLSLD